MYNGTCVSDPCRLEIYWHCKILFQVSSLARVFKISATSLQRVKSEQESSILLFWLGLPAGKNKSRLISKSLAINQ